MRILRSSRIRRATGALLVAVIAIGGALVAASPAAASATTVEAAPPTIATTISDAGFAHPGVGFTADHLENMRTQVRAGVDPWASYYDAMTRTKYAARDYRAENAQPGTDTPKNDAYASAGMRAIALRDSIGAMTQALEYAVTGDEQYRANALHVIRTWSGLDPAKYAYFADAHIHTGVPLYYLLIAAEVIRSTEPVNADLGGYDLRWTDTDQQRIEDNLIRPVLSTFLSSNNRLWNQHLYGVIGMVSAAIFLDDAALYAERVEWFTVNAGYRSEHDLYGGDVNGALASIFREIPADHPANTTGAPFVQHMEMLRDQAHGQGDVDLLVALARIVDAQGTTVDPVSGAVSEAAGAVSPYAFLDNRILDGADTFYAFMMGEDVPYVPATEGGAISEAYRGRLQDPLSEAYLQYRYVAGVDVETVAPHVAQLYEQRDGPLYYYGTGVQNFWSDRGSDYTGAEYWVAFPEELAEVTDAAAPLAPSAELSVATFGQPLGDGAVRGASDGTAFISLDASAPDAQLAVRRAIWGDRSKTSLVGIKVRSDATARLQLSRTATEAPFAEVVVPDTAGEWRYVWGDLDLAQTPGAIGDNIVFVAAEGSEAQIDVAGVLAQANGTLTPPRFADGQRLDVVVVADEPWTRPIEATDAAGAVSLDLHDAPAGATLTDGILSWEPASAGSVQMLVAASDGTAVTALPVTVTVAASREAAIAAYDDRVGDEATYTSASWSRLVEARQNAVGGIDGTDAAAFAALLEDFGDAVDALVPLSPRLADGSLDYRTLITAAPLGAPQLGALVDGDNQTHWGDQRVPSIVFDAGAGFRIDADRFGFQARDTFGNRAQGTNVYGSDDAVNWTLLTTQPNAGQDAAVEWIDVRADVQDSRFRFLKLQVDEPGVPSDPAFPGIWSIAEFRIDGARYEAVGTMDAVSVSSPDAVARRVVAGDRIEVRLTGPAGNTEVAVSVLGAPASVTSTAPGQWLATTTVPAGVERGAPLALGVAFRTPEDEQADPVHATTDGSTLFVSSDEGSIDEAVRAAAVLRPDGVADTAWTTYTKRMLDGDAATHSDTRLNSGLYGNVWDFGAEQTVSITGSEILVRQDGYGTSRISDMRLEGSNDMQTWTRLTPRAPAKTLDWQQWPVTGVGSFRFVRLVNGQILNVAELHLFGAVTPVDRTSPIVTVKEGTDSTVGADGTYQLVSFALEDAGGLQAVVLNGTETALGGAAQASVDGILMAENGGRIGENTLTVRDAAGNATTVTFTLIEPVFRVPAWSGTTVYRAGDEVSYGGAVHVAQWWTCGETPGSTATGAWMERGMLVPAAGDGVRGWTRSWIYDDGDVVAYGGRLWEAKWWTRDQVPGAAKGPAGKDPWTDLGAYGAG